MNKEEWNQSTDIVEMLDFLWSNYSEDVLVPLLHDFFLKCARNIEVLLPQKESVRGIDIGEKYLSGEINGQTLSDENWAVEGAAFCIDYNTDPKNINQWVAQVNLINRVDLDKILNLENAEELDSRQLLLDAAYYVDHAMVYPTCSHKKRVREGYKKFLQPDILRNIISDPRSINT